MHCQHPRPLSWLTAASPYRSPLLLVHMIPIYRSHFCARPHVFLALVRLSRVRVLPPMPFWCPVTCSPFQQDAALSSPSFCSTKTSLLPVFAPTYPPVLFQSQSSLQWTQDLLGSIYLEGSSCTFWPHSPPVGSLCYLLKRTSTACQNRALCFCNLWFWGLDTPKKCFKIWNPNISSVAGNTDFSHVTPSPQFAPNVSSVE